MSSIANGSAPTKRSRKASNTASTGSAHPSRLASPQPNAPSSLSTRTNSQRGGTRKVSIRAILRAIAVRPIGLCSATGHEPAGRVAGLVVGMLADFLDRHHEADARRRKHVAPVGDQLLIGLADVADLAVEIEQPERVDVAVLLAERRVPIDLVGQAVPGESDGRYADVAQAQNVGPFLPQPFDGFVAMLAFP